MNLLSSQTLTGIIWIGGAATSLLLVNLVVGHFRPVNLLDRSGKDLTEQ
jgi:hypothetical protein